MGTHNHHEYSIEKLFHLSCGECKQWWSYATEDGFRFGPVHQMTCPHCGEKRMIMSTDTLKNENPRWERDVT